MTMTKPYPARGLYLSVSLGMLTGCPQPKCELARGEEWAFVVDTVMAAEEVQGITRTNLPSCADRFDAFTTTRRFPFRVVDAYASETLCTVIGEPSAFWALNASHDPGGDLSSGLCGGSHCITMPAAFMQGDCALRSDVEIWDGGNAGAPRFQALRFLMTGLEPSASCASVTPDAARFGGILLCVDGLRGHLERRPLP